MSNKYAEILTTAIGSRFLDERGAAELTRETPLLELGILTSMNTAVLLTELREVHNIDVPHHEVTGRNLATIETFANLLQRLDQAQAKVNT